MFNNTGNLSILRREQVKYSKRPETSRRVFLLLGRERYEMRAEKYLVI